LRSLFVRVHVAPASSERNTPPESCSMIAQRRLGFAALTVMPMLPMSPCWGSPLLRVISVHLSPPSVLLKIPDPAPPETSCHGLRPACQKAA
jgi:hypothetical protein